MNQPSGRGKGKIDSMQLLKEKPPIIGCGEWESYQSDYFTGDDERGLSIGDIILVREGKTPIALCEIEGESFQNTDLTKKYLHENYREVKVLKWWNEAEEIPLSEGTLNRLINPNTASWKFINKVYINFLKEIEMENFISLLENKQQIILQGPPGTGKTYKAKDIAEMMIFREISINKKLQKQRLESTDQFKLIQFHSAYSYEDFVRGISAKSKGDGIEYITENRTLGQFANIALTNYINSHKSPKEFSEILWIDDQFEGFVDSIREKLENNAGQIGLTEAISIVNIDEDAFRYKGQDGWNPYGNRMLFKDIKKSFLDKNNSRQDIVKNSNLSGLARHHASYFYKVLDLFRKFLIDNNIVFTPSDDGGKLKNYILIIDEINRANLPAVLGELIYALEYRGEQVESMYEIEGEGKNIILPPNLYIIGTMNTADRSVGHIDYAIRRRFAFVHIPPDVNVISEVIKEETLQGKAENLFNSVSELFTKKNETSDSLLYLAPDFKAEDVQIGHSYFLAENEEKLKMKLEYEIKPILREYIKDGILNESAREIADKLHV